MRPEILNPLFTEVEALKGVGPQVAKLLKKLDLSRIVDLLYHLPTGAIERIRPRRRRRRCSAATSFWT
jgi:ATP-dependent DNA helicase RecG